MPSLLLIEAIIETAAVLLWCGRGFWRCYPGWTFYGALAVVQTWLVFLWNGDVNKSAAVWCLFGPFLILGLLDSVMELFVRLSHLYKRFERDRWVWLALPILVGCLFGMLLVWEQLNRPSNFYRGLFLAQTAAGSIFASVLLISWTASLLHARIPPLHPGAWSKPMQKAPSVARTVESAG